MFGVGTGGRLSTLDLMIMQDDLDSQKEEYEYSPSRFVDSFEVERIADELFKMVGEEHIDGKTALKKIMKKRKIHFSQMTELNQVYLETIAESV